VKTFPDQPVDLPQRVLAATSRTEAKAAVAELNFKDRLDDHLQRRLHHTVPDRGDPKRAGPPVRLRNLHPANRMGLVGSRLQLLVKLVKIPRLLGLEQFDTD